MSASAPALFPAAAEPAVVIGTSADSLRQYRFDLAVAVRRFRAYPALARARGWEGVVELSVRGAEAARTPAVVLIRGSSYEVLDSQAESMVTRAVAAVPVPDALRGKAFEVPMPIRFSLEE